MLFYLHSEIRKSIRLSSEVSPETERLRESWRRRILFGLDLNKNTKLAQLMVRPSPRQKSGLVVFGFLGVFFGSVPVAALC